MGKVFNLVGQRFGLLAVRERACTQLDAVAWLCVCDCGGVATETTHRLTSGKRQSCGCLKSSPKHGEARRAGKSSTYRAWEDMRSRCNRPSAGGYKFYGGRGIKVCARWDSYENFIADMGERPTGMTLERRDCHGNYEPLNCRWATRAEQDVNKRSTFFVEYQGRRQSLKLWCDELHLNYDRTYYRLNAGHPVSAAFSVGRLPT